MNPARPAWFLLLVLLPGVAHSQGQCEQVRAHTERLRQHVEQQRARGVPWEQLNADIEIYNRWVSARDRVCSGRGAAAGGTDSRQQSIADLQRLLGMLGTMNSTAPGSIDFERELQAQLRVEEQARRLAEEDAARRRGNVTNPFATGADSGGAANPFGAAAPSHRLPSVPGTKVETGISEPRPASGEDNPFGSRGATPPNPAGQRSDVINVEIVNASPQPFGSGTGTTSSRFRKVQEATACIQSDDFVETLAGPRGTSGYFTARNSCSYHVIGVGCFKRQLGGETCVNVGGPPGWTARIAFAFADTPGKRISMNWFACRNDGDADASACIESVRAYRDKRDDGKRP